jgi:hypothetical protein
MQFHSGNTHVLHSYTVAGVCTQRGFVRVSGSSRARYMLPIRWEQSRTPPPANIRPRVGSFDRAYGACLHRMSAATWRINVHFAVMRSVSLSTTHFSDDNLSTCQNKARSEKERTAAESADGGRSNAFSHSLPMLSAFHVSDEVPRALVSQSLAPRRLLLRVENILEDFMIR